MIHDEICTYEVAKLAKENGFNLHCTPFYALENFTAEYVDDAGDFYEVDFEKGDLYLNYPVRGLLHKDKMLSAPTQSLLQRWLREEKKIVFSISPMQEMDCDYLGWCATIYEVDEDGYGLSWKEELYYNTYELALENALAYALENLV